KARALNAGFVKWAQTRRPLVTLKAAITLDGRMATGSGDSKWVTGEAARLEAHRLRDASDAVLVGAGTVRADDPALTTRLPGGRGRDALRVILDGALTVPPNAKAVVPGTVIVTVEGKTAAQLSPYVARGAEVVPLRASPPGSSRVDLGALLDELGRRGALELLVEGGADVHGAFLAAGLADRLVAFIAPRLAGD